MNLNFRLIFSIRYDLANTNLGRMNNPKKKW